jgi:1,4-alpha-glucan branching enzyme
MTSTSLGELDLHLIAEGRHEQLWRVLGAQPQHDPVGTTFRVWAPNALEVEVIGDFNGWRGSDHRLEHRGAAVWELFVPGVVDGARYKFHLRGRDDVWRDKADPLARAAEIPPLTASVVTESSYAWADDLWMTGREHDPATRPMSVYEVHLASWRSGLSYTELAEQLTAYVVETGFTHVEFLPVMEHPYGGSWGYQVTGYFAPTSRLGSPDELRHLIDTLHQAGIGVLLDWVPAHFPKDEFALARFDGEPVYEHPDPFLGEHPDWGTLVFDFGRPEVRNFLVANALYWLEEFHVDGLRVDAVASMLYLDYSREPGQWTPNVHGGRENLEAVDFLRELNDAVHRTVPGAIVIAEESTAWEGVTRPTEWGGLGFDLKWNMGWMHDSLGYVQREPVHRSWHHGEMAFTFAYAWSERYVLPLSHDEVVHGKGSLLRKMPGDRWQALANLRAYYGYMWAHPGKQLLFMGCEFGQESEWAEARELDWWLLDNPEHKALQTLVRDLNGVYRDTPALWAADADPEAFTWIDANDAGRSLFSFIRRGGDGPELVCISNFSPNPHLGLRIGLPATGTWDEVLNTDAGDYTGSGVGNLGSVVAEEIPWSGQPASAAINVPPLATVWLRRG